MAKKKKETNAPVMASMYETAQVMSEYSKLIESDPAYSLDVDPKNKYKMTEQEKSFVRFYLEYRNIPLVAKVLDIDDEQAFAIFSKYTVQQEIKRINRSLYTRQFQTKILTIPQLAAYLTSFIIDTDVPEANKLSTAGKVDLAKYLINLNITMSEAMTNPSKVMTSTFETKVKDMSVEAIKQMITAGENIDKKKELIDKINVDNKLTLEDMSILETLSVDQLLNILSKIEGEGNGKSQNS